MRSAPTSPTRGPGTRLVSEMVLIVDFNMTEEDGRIPALIRMDEEPPPTAGTEVVAVDGEGTECRAVVDEVAEDGSYVMLTPLDGTFHTSSSRATHRAR